MLRPNSQYQVLELYCRDWPQSGGRGTHDHIEITLIYKYNEFLGDDRVGSENVSSISSKIMQYISKTQLQSIYPNSRQLGCYSSLELKQYLTSHPIQGNIPMGPLASIITHPFSFIYALNPFGTTLMTIYYLYQWGRHTCSIPHTHHVCIQTSFQNNHMLEMWWVKWPVLHIISIGQIFFPTTFFGPTLSSLSYVIIQIHSRHPTCHTTRVYRRMAMINTKATLTLAMCIFFLARTFSCGFVVTLTLNICLQINPISTH